MAECPVLARRNGRFGSIPDCLASAIIQPCTIITTFAFHVRDLHARGITVELIAQRVNASVDDVLEAHRVMNLPANDADESIQYKTDAEREAALERMPKKMQDRIRRTKT